MQVSKQRLSPQQAQVILPLVGSTDTPRDKLDNYTFDVDEAQARAVLAACEKNKWTALARAVMPAISSNPEELPAGPLDVLYQSLLSALRGNFLRGWMYDHGKPFLITDVQKQANRTTGERYVELRGVYGTIRDVDDDDAAEVCDQTSQHNGADLIPDANKTLAELLALHDLELESPSKFQEYVKRDAAYYALSQAPGEQYRMTYTGRTGKHYYSDVVRYKNAKVASLPFSPVFRAKVPNKLWNTLGVPADVVAKLAPNDAETVRAPTDHRMPVGVLQGWNLMAVPMQVLTGYDWQVGVFDKLVLPARQLDVIRRLSRCVRKGGNDLVENKGGGSTILSIGGPGRGKTLTAELVSEEQKMPLIRLNASALGDSASSVSKKLRSVMQVAGPLELAVLIDEADVYIRPRDDDMRHCAIVTEILQLLEYQQGLLFLNTNRDTVDAAIVSRCKAVLAYGLPNAEELYDLFVLHAELVGLTLPEGAAERLSTEHAGKLAGRDVHNVLDAMATMYAPEELVGEDDNQFPAHNFDRVFLDCAALKAVLTPQGDATDGLPDPDKWNWR